MKYRILIFSIAYEPLIGGAELAVRNITDRLLSCEFDLITCRFAREHPAFEKIGNVSVYRVGFGGRLGKYLYPIFASRLSKKLHRRHPYSLVWSIMAAYGALAALLFLRSFPSVKFLLTLQEGDAIEHIHQQVAGFHKQWSRIFKRADYIQAISSYLADWAREEGAICPIEVVPNGVAVEKFQIRNSTPSSSPPYQGGEREGVIITTSRLVPKNGIDILIRAVAVIASGAKQSQGQEIATRPAATRNDIRLLILGRGPEEKKLKKLARDLAVQDIVEFVGEVPPDKIPEYLARADIFVRPSRSEGLGTSFLEAMAVGLPVIGTSVGGIPDFLKDRETGLFCKEEDPKDLAKKIKLLSDDASLRTKIALQGQRLVFENYSWDYVASKVNAIFAKLI